MPVGWYDPSHSCSKPQQNLVAMTYQKVVSDTIAGFVKRIMAPIIIATLYPGYPLFLFVSEVML